MSGDSLNDVTPLALPFGGYRAKKRLLLADDDRIVTAALSAQLQAEFEIVGAVGDAETAIEAARRTQPDVALIDVQMPQGGGLRAIRGIRELSPRTALVVLSVDEMESSVVDLLSAGAVSYLRKGTTAPAIARRLHESIAAHGSFEQPAAP